MKFIIAFDSFKECIGSIEAGIIAERAVKNIFPDAEIEVFAAADGGEGTAEISASYCNAARRIIVTHDALFDSIEADYYFNESTKEAFIDFASASGLALIAPSKRDPFAASSYGTGEIIRHAIAAGAKKITVCFGGSATNDGGIGFLQALGARFYDKKGILLTPPVSAALIPEISKINVSSVKELCEDIKFTGLYDSIVPFCGTGGASLVFAPQKGASHEDAHRLDEMLAHLKSLYSAATGKECDLFPGSGAAGGAAGALGWVLGAEMISGSKEMIQRMDLKSADPRETIIITGEGKSDFQTLTGKLPGEILCTVKARDLPVYLFSGRIEDASMLLKAGFQGVFAITPKEQPLHEALLKKSAERNLYQAVVAFCKNLKSNSLLVK